MKKIILLTCSLIGSSLIQAKEITTTPISNVPEVMNESIIVEEFFQEPTLVQEVLPVSINDNPWGFFNFRIGTNLTSKYDDYTYNNQTIFSKKTKDFGGEVSIEGYKSFDNFNLGLGLAYQSHMDRKTNISNNNVSYSGAEYDSIPIYLTGRYNFDFLELAFIPYIKANFGYSFNFNSKSINESFNGNSLSYSTNTDDGIYWATGFGVEYQNFNVDLLYGINQAKTKISNNLTNEKYDNNYDSLTLSVGYKFDIY